MKNTLIIGDTHIPFEHKKYLGFCQKVRDKYDCENIYHIGDIVDNHAINFHTHDPDGFGAADEYRRALKTMRKWYAAFHKVKLCYGNHDEMVKRRALSHGIPDEYVKSFREIWRLPKQWKVEFQYQENGIKFMHGTGFSGLYPHVNAVRANRQSCVIGHLHSVAGVHWSASDHDLVFGMSVGCGVDHKAYAFNYGRDFARKVVLGCGVITDNGKSVMFIGMNL